MTEVETLIAIGGTIAGTILGIAITHLFEQRGKAQQTRQDVAFKPSEDRHIALKTIYSSMDDCLYSFFRTITNMPKTMEDYLVSTHALGYGAGDELVTIPGLTRTK